MVICEICGQKISFPVYLSIKGVTPSKAYNSIGVCGTCSKDMYSLRVGDAAARERIFHYTMNSADERFRGFLEAWQNPVNEDEIDKALLQENLRKEEARQEALRKEAERKEALAKMLISSGFSFEGHKIVKYSGYISGDDVTQLPRSGIFGSDNGKKLTDALVKIRQNALRELKEAAYDLGCNAIIGVDFDYITLEPETANIVGGTLYEPYLICVTANGNAVIIEKE